MIVFLRQHPVWQPLQYHTKHRFLNTTHAEPRSSAGHVGLTLPQDARGSPNSDAALSASSQKRGSICAMMQLVMNLIIWLLYNRLKKYKSAIVHLLFAWC